MSLLKKQIISFENAEKLKDLGFHQASLFYYVNNYRSPNGNEIDNGQHIIAGERKHLTRVEGRKRGTEVELLSAYTLSELLIFSIYSFSTTNLIANRVATTLIDALEGADKSFIEKYNSVYREFFDLIS